MPEPNDEQEKRSVKTTILPTMSVPPPRAPSRDQATLVIPAYRPPQPLWQHVAEHATHGQIALTHQNLEQPAHPDAAGANPWLTLIVLCLGFFMVLLDTTIVSIAVPRIVDGLQSSLDQILWVLNAYVLIFAVLLLPAGRLGDIYGERTLFAAGVAVFTIASALCGFATDTTQLIIGRLVQGVGAALLTPQTIAILVAVFPPEKRGAAFGVWGAVAGAAAIAGPALGGLIVTYSSWRVIFFVNLPVGLITLVLIFLFVPNLRRSGKHSLDPVGIVLAALGLSGIIFGLIEGPPYNWGSIAGPISVPVIIGAGMLVFAAFLVWEHFHHQPLLPLSMFESRNYSLMNWVGAVMEFAILGFFTPLTLYYQSVLGMSARDAGLALSPLPVAAMFLAPAAGILADRLGGKYILTTGLSLFAIGTAWFAVQAQTGSTWVTFLAPLVVAGIGMGCIFAPLGAMAMQDVSEDQAGVASGVINTTRLLGAVVGGAVIGAVLQSSLTSSLSHEATARAGELPASLREPFVALFSGSSLDVGPEQSQAAELARQASGADGALVVRVAHEVFVNGFVSAMRPTIAVAVVLVALAAVSCLLLKRSAAAKP